MTNTVNNLSVSDSATVAINSLAQQKIAAGLHVYNFSAGEPKLATHELIIQSVTASLSQERIYYPPVSGIPELKILAAEWINAEYACNYRPDNCLVVNGGKFGIYLALQLLLKPDDEVIIPSPYWVSYPAIVKIFGGRSTSIETNEIDGWKITPKSLANAYTKKSKILILNNAANPTGALYTKQELSDLLKFAHDHQLIVISDEVYSGLIYDEAQYISCGSFSEYQDNIVVIQSCSKSFAMTGWRIGFVFAAASIIKPLTSLMSQSTSGVSVVSQWTAIVALKHFEKITAHVKGHMQNCRDSCINAFNQYFNITIKPPLSALYFFISLNDLGVKNINAVEFCTQVLEEANIALVPGDAFGKPGYIRFSFTAELKDLEEGIKALAAYIKARF